jgi:hypothetical protein
MAVRLTELTNHTAAKIEPLSAITFAVAPLVG